VSTLAERDASTGPQTSLVDLLDRLLGTGVVISGDVTICLAGVDLVTIKLRALIASVAAVEGRAQ
jgi:hypothetical protein